MSVSIGALCALCDVCQTISRPAEPPILGIGDYKSRILILDTRYVVPDDDYNDKVERFVKALGTDAYLSYTTRCYSSGPVSDEMIDEMVDSCSVWTHSIASHRAIIALTAEGYRQLKVHDDFKVGTIKQTHQWGYLLCMPPLTSMTEKEMPVYVSHMKRLMKEMRIQ